MRAAPVMLRGKREPWAEEYANLTKSSDEFAYMI